MSKHQHVGDPMKLCTGCIPEALELQAEFRRRRFWGWIIVGFSLVLAAGSPIALCYVGMRR